MNIYQSVLLLHPDGLVLYPRASVDTALSGHPCVSSCLWNNSTPLGYVLLYQHIQTLHINMKNFIHAHVKKTTPHKVNVLAHHNSILSLLNILYHTLSRFLVVVFYVPPMPSFQDIPNTSTTFWWYINSILNIYFKTLWVLRDWIHNISIVLFKVCT